MLASLGSCHSMEGCTNSCAPR